MQPPAPAAASPGSVPPGVPPDRASWDPPRMAALVQITQGLAPPLSDLLTVIRGQAGLLLNAATESTASPEPLNQIFVAAEKAGSLLRQLLIFSGQMTMQAERLALNGLIEETAGVVRRLVGREIAVELRLAANLPPIAADPEMIEQLLIILAQNARDAMPAGGRLTVTTGVTEASEPAPPGGSARPPGSVVVLTVEDTGAGIAPEIQPRIFEPFFTTKAGGRRLGLGLATAAAIVRQHQGRMTVNSIVNVGTSFSILLPAAPAGAAAASGRSAEAVNRKGHETILLVEDDDAVREFTVTVLQEHGYRVLQAGSGADALEAWKWHAPRVRLLLTDMVLEDHMTGLELAARLRAEDPTLKVICTSGHGRDTMKKYSAPSGNYLFLQKPCRPQVLVAAVRALLDAPAP